MLFIALVTSATSTLHAQANQLSEEQLQRWLKRFPEADADGDGVLTVEEAADYREAAASQRNTAGNQRPDASTRELNFDPGWELDRFPESAVSYRTPAEILSIYEKGPKGRPGPGQETALSFPKPTDGALRIVGTGHSFMAPGYKTLPLICRAAGFEQPMCLHTGGGVTGSTRYKWEQENGIFEFAGEPVPRLLAAISNSDWEAMTWGGYHQDRPEFYTCWVEFCTRFHPDMKFYLSDAWPQIFQLAEIYDLEKTPESEALFTDDALERMLQSRQESTMNLVRQIRDKTTEMVFIMPTAAAVTEAARLFNKGELPGVEGLHMALGGKERSIWRDRTGHLGPGFERLEGYVFYATLYGKSPELIVPAIDFPGDPQYPGEELDRIFRRIAWQAVINHPFSGVTDKNHNQIGDHLE